MPSTNQITQIAPHLRTNFRGTSLHKYHVSNHVDADYQKDVQGPAVDADGQDVDRYHLAGQSPLPWLDSQTIVLDVLLPLSAHMSAGFCNYVQLSKLIELTIFMNAFRIR